MFEDIHDQQDSQWCESFHKSTEPDSHQTAKYNFLSSDGLAQNCVNLSQWFHPKQQLVSIYNFEVSQGVCNHPPIWLQLQTHLSSKYCQCAWNKYML